MPYPQFTLAQRNNIAPKPQLGDERKPAARPHWSDRNDPAELEAAQVETKNTRQKVADTTSKSIHNDTPSSSKISSLSSPSRLTQPIDIPRTSQPTEIAQRVSPNYPPYTYKCTLCWKEDQPPCYTIGPESRIVCLDCWRWIHSVSICWKCNEVVYRKEDAVSFGWC